MPQAPDDDTSAEQVAKRLLQTYFPPDVLFMRFFGRLPSSEPDHKAEERFTEALLDDLKLEIALGKNPQQFLVNFNRQIDKSPPARHPHFSLAEVTTTIKRFYAALREASHETNNSITERLVFPLSEPDKTGSDADYASAGSSTRLETGAELGTNIQTNEPVILTDALRPRHISIIGRTGYGKTTLLEHLILEDVRTHTTAIIIDPHGDLSQRIISLTNAGERERITLLEVWPERPFRLNLLTCPDPSQLDRTVDDILTLFHRLFDTGDVQIGHRLHRYFGNALRTLIPNGGTLAQVQQLFYDDAFRADMLRAVNNSKVHEFWTTYYQIPMRERFDQLESTINRLDEFLSSETALAMVSSQQTTVPLDSVLAQDGRILLIRIPIGELGEQQARFYGSMFLSLLTDQLFSRAQLSQSERPRLHLYLDEYGWFATSTTATLLQQARKYNLGATIAFQTLADLPDEKNRQAALQVGTFIVLRLVGQNADELVSEFPVIPTRETIEESIGFRQITSVSPTPIEHLITSGHSNEQVRAAIHAFLKPLFTKVEETRQAEKRSHGAPQTPRRAQSLPRIGWAEPRVSPFLQAFDLLDGLLVAVMEQEQDSNNDSLAITLVEVFDYLKWWRYRSGAKRGTEDVMFATLIGTSGGRAIDSPEMQTRLVRHVCEGAQAADPRAYFANARYNPDTLWTWLRAYAQQHYPAYDDTKVYTSSELAHFAAQLQANNDDISRVITRYADLIEADAAHLIILCRILATEPILVPTGQEREEFRGRVHIQTFADARIELAGILANLREYTAYYQIGSLHGQVALAPPLEPQALNEQAITEVRERSKALYGVPLDALDEETSSDLSGSPRPPGLRSGPRVTRRPPGPPGS